MPKSPIVVEISVFGPLNKFLTWEAVLRGRDLIVGGNFPCSFVARYGGRLQFSPLS